MIECNFVVIWINIVNCRCDCSLWIDLCVYMYCVVIDFVFAFTNNIKRAKWVKFYRQYTENITLLAWKSMENLYKRQTRYSSTNQRIMCIFYCIYKMCFRCICRVKMCVNLANSNCVHEIKVFYRRIIFKKNTKQTRIEWNRKRKNKQKRTIKINKKNTKSKEI